MMKQAKTWKALSDPTRREILDILRKEPATTGMLCTNFEHLTRYAVMKHLGILEDAGLIFIKREGKFRWNYLNVTPIQEIHERWVKPFEALWAESGLKIKQLVESNKGEEAMADKKTERDYHHKTVELEIVIQAEPEKVWDALVHKVDSWWRDDFYAVENSAVVLEPRVGGRLYEHNDRGDEGLWYTITGFYPQRQIDLVGHLQPQYGGPATTMLQLALEAGDDHTVLKIKDVLYGSLGPNAFKSIKEGWQLLLGEGLKPFVEAA